PFQLKVFEGISYGYVNMNVTVKYALNLFKKAGPTLRKANKDIPFKCDEDTSDSPILYIHFREDMLENILLHKYLIAEKGIKVHVVNKAVYTSRRVIKLKLTKWSETPDISASGNLCVRTITLERSSHFSNILKTREFC
ncbi:MAG: hypothetical protein QW182_07610, partial [Thermosphaera sp.]